MGNNNDLKTKIEEEEIAGKMARYCEYQERCIREVKDRLNRYQLREELKDRIVERLIREGFIDEERFTRTYIRSKFLNNKWGKIRIRHSLREMDIKDDMIDKAMDEIPAEDYLSMALSLINQKNKSLKDVNLFIRRNKIARFLIMKGFEPGMVWEQIKSAIE